MRWFVRASQRPIQDQLGTPRTGPARRQGASQPHGCGRHYHSESRLVAARDLWQVILRRPALPPRRYRGGSRVATEAVGRRYLRVSDAVSASPSP